MSNATWLIMLALFGVAGYFAPSQSASMFVAIASGVFFSWAGYLTAYGEMGRKRE